MNREYLSKAQFAKINSREMPEIKFATINPAKISSLTIGRDKYIYTPFPRMNTWSAKYIKVEKIEMLLMDINQKLYVRWEGT